MSKNCWPSVFSKNLVLISFCATVSGCAGVPGDVKQVSSAQMVVDTQIQKSADDVYGEIKLLNANSGGASRPTITLPSPVSGCSLHLVSIDYDGSASKFIGEVKSAGFCQVRVVGKRPPQDLLVSLHHHHVPLWHVLEDFGVQIGSQARVDIAVDSVEIRYPGQVADVSGAGKQ